MALRRPDVERLLDPLDVLSDIVQASSVSEAWFHVSVRLVRAGFNQPCFFYSNTAPAAGRVVLTGTAGIQQLGVLISEDYMRAARSDPSIQTSSREIQRGVRSLEPIVWASDEYLRQHTEAELSVMQRLQYEFHVRGCIARAFRSARSGAMYGIICHNFDTMPSFKMLCDQHGTQFFLAAAYATDALDVMRHGENMARTVLSKRERECLLWIINGKTNQEIGEIMSLSDETVKEYVSRAMKKLGANSRAQACARAILYGLLKP